MPERLDSLKGAARVVPIRMRAVLVENMLVRREADNLYLPAAPRCLLGGDMPNVVAVVAGAYRLWDEFMAKSRSARSSW